MSKKLSKRILKKLKKKNKEIEILGMSYDFLVFEERGDLHLQLGNFKEAYDDFEKSFVLKKENTPILEKRAKALIGLKQFDKAKEDIETLLKENPNDLGALYTKASCFQEEKKMDEYVACLDKIIELSKGKFPAAYDDKGLLHYEKKEYDQSLECFKKVVEIDKKDYVGWCHLGRAYQKLDKKDDAIECYGKALELNGKYTVALQKRSWLYFNMDKFTEAKEDFRTIVSLDEEDPISYSNFALVCFKLEENQKALNLLGKSLRIFGSQPGIFSKKERAITLKRRGWVFQKMEKKKEAINDFKSAIKLDETLKEEIEPKIKECEE